MLEWLTGWLGHLQGGIVQTLAGELRAGGLGAIGLAVALGALHALTPGHGKAALAAYLLGRESQVGKGLRIAMSAAMLHVLCGFAIFIVMRLVLGQAPTMLGRNAPAITAVGYAVIIAAGLIMVAQSLRTTHAHGDGANALTAGIGLLPCPLTISVLGFAWVQSSPAMVFAVLASLALGIALTISLVALVSIVARRSLGVALAAALPGIERWSRVLQGVAGAAIVAIGVTTLLALVT